MALFIIIFILILVVASFAVVGWHGAPWVTTKKSDVERFLRLADIKSGQIFYELGSGDGRLVCAAAEAGAQAYGFEIALIPYLLAQFRRLRSPARERIHFQFKSFWKISFKQADVVYMFLLPEIYENLKDKFKKELKPGAVVIAYAWRIKGWEAIEMDEKEKALKLCKYQILKT
jgi:SAM-dependent methyltransferase